MTHDVPPLAPTSGMRLRAAFRGLVHDRLVVFALVGGALFVVQRFTEDRDDEVIAVSGATVRELEREIEDRLGRAPTAEERARAIAAWRRDEALYREGLRRGLDAGDPIVRRRIIDKLLEIHEQLAPPIPPPTEMELEAWLARNEDHELVRLHRSRGDQADAQAPAAVERREGLHALARDALAREHRRAYAETMVDAIVGRYRFREEP